MEKAVDDFWIEDDVANGQSHKHSHHDRTGGNVFDETYFFMMIPGNKIIGLFNRMIKHLCRKHDPNAKNDHAPFCGADV